MPLIYTELRRLAAWHLRRERREHTLQPTALVHEAYLRLLKVEQAVWSDRIHFFGAASHSMRRILVDHARRRGADKRGGGRPPVELQEGMARIVEDSTMMLALDQALTRLASRDPRQCQVVEMRFFGSLTEEEIGLILNISSRTVKREWEHARTWLQAELSR